MVAPVRGMVIALWIKCAPTMAEMRKAEEQRLLAEAKDHPAVAQLLSAFPDSLVTIEQN